MRKRRRLTALFLSFRKPITFYVLTAAVAAGFRRNHTRVQHDRINDLYDRSRLVAVRPQLHIAAVLDILRGKDARAAFAAEQYNTFVKYRLTVNRARRVQRFLSQPFAVAEQFTGVPGVMVPIEDTIRGFRMIMDGETDHIPEQAFLNVGTIEDVMEKAKRLAEQAN